MYSVKELRKQFKLTQAEAAKLAGLKYSTFVAIEDGRGEGFNIDFKIRIAKIFGVSLFRLFPEEQRKIEEIIQQDKQESLYKAKSSKSVPVQYFNKKEN